MANHFHEDAQGTEFEFQNNAGDAGGDQRVPVFDLIATIKTQFTNMVSHLSSIATAIAGTLTVGLPTGASTAANQSTGNGSLASILAALNPASCVAGQNTDIDTASEDLGSQACTVGAWVKNISTSSQKIYVSPNNVAATTTNGYELAAGEERFFSCRNISELKVIASAVNASASWLAI